MRNADVAEVAGDEGKDAGAREGDEPGEQRERDRDDEAAVRHGRADLVDAHQANAYVPWVYVDVKPVLGANFAMQTANSSYAANLDKNIAIGLKLHLGTIKTGVTFGVGQDVTTEIASANGVATIFIDGYPTSVPVAGSSKDCVGASGKAVALVNQFQSIVVPQNDPLGFGVESASGNLYVGSNGTCKLSTPVWNADTKHFRYTSSAPALSPDGSKTNKGFYHAVISFADAKAYWGLDKPQDAAKALTVSIMTSAGGSTAAIATISARNNKIIIDDFGDSSGLNQSRASIMATGFFGCNQPSSSAVVTVGLGTGLNL